VNAPFHFLVSDTFLIEGRGLILAPFFPVNKYHFDNKERLRVEAPDGRVFEVDAEFQIPCVSPMPEIFQMVCLLRSVEKSDVPVGSRVVVLTKTEEQVEGPSQ
jgi:hypothetical protein